MSVATTTSAPRRPRSLGSGPVVAAFAVVYVVWGSTYLFIRIAGESIPPLLMAGIRFVVAGGILYAATATRGEPAADPVGPRQWGAAAVAGALLLVGGNGMVSYGETFVASGTVALLVATVPLFVALFGGAFLGRRLRPAAIAGIGIGLLGTTLLIRPGGGGDAAHMALVLVAPVAWAAGSLYSTRAPLPKRPLVTTAMEMLTAGLMLIALAAAVGEFGSFHPDRVPLTAWLSLLYLIAFGSILAFSCYVWLLSEVPTTAVATYAYVNPVVAVFLGAVVLGEPVGATTLLAAAAIIVAVLLILSPPRRRAHRAS
ncbi:MAG: EamA family transporter [Candidatus Dormibacteria bacterium]